MQSPCIFVVAGPNGAGKSTTAPALLRDRFHIQRYLNADTIAAGISAFNPDSTAFQAGRIMLQEMQRLRERKETFAFETTLSSRSYAQWLDQARSVGYKVGFLFLALPSAEAALERVAHRVRAGGHDIPEVVVRRRYERGLSNFFQRYQPLADRWVFNDNGGRRTQLLAHGGIGRTTVEIGPIYGRLKEQYGSR
jgi:predicted ABC-type ATPase